VGLVAICYYLRFEASFLSSPTTFRAYCGGVRARLHAIELNYFITSERAEYKSPCLTAPLLLCFLCLSVAAGMCLPNPSPAPGYSASIRCSRNALTEPLPSNGHIRHSILLPSSTVCSFEYTFSLSYSLNYFAMLELSWGVKSDRRVRLTNLPPSMSRLSRRCRSLDLSHPYGPSRPVTGTAFLVRASLSFSSNCRNFQIYFFTSVHLLYILIKMF
jgi:hypothetical protein